MARGANIIRLIAVLRHLTLLCVAMLSLVAFRAEAQAPDTASASIPPEIRARWGILADLAGRDFYHPLIGAMEMYRWSSPGRILTQIDRTRDGSTLVAVFVLEDNGSLVRTHPIVTPGVRSPVTLNADGSAVIHAPGYTSYIERIVDGGLRIRGCNARGQCTRQTVQFMARQSADVQSLAARVREENRSVFANPPGQLAGSIQSVQATSAPNTVPPSALATPSTPADLRARWGILADLAGRTFCYSDCNSDAFYHYRWLPIGQRLVLEIRVGQRPARFYYELTAAGTVITYDERTPHLATPVTFNADGSFTALYLERGGDSGTVERASLTGTQLSRSTCHTPSGQCGTGIYNLIDGGAAESIRQRAARRLSDLSASLPILRVTVVQSPLASSPLAAVSAPAPPQASPITPPAAVVQPVVPAAAAGARVALVVGVSTYGTLGNLTNPANDARALAAALRAIGFDVDLVVDPDQRTLRAAISRLGERMGRAGRGATGLFFFAGHGIQTRGTNYLIPAGALISREADVELEAVAADNVLTQMQEAGVSTNIIILDACRNMPLTRSFRSGSRGLAQMDAPNGTFIAYSTAPGSVAADGSGANSPFATALLREIAQPGQPIETVFRNVRRSVLRDTEGQQTPWDSSSLVEPFYFRAE